MFFIKDLQTNTYIGPFNERGVANWWTKRFSRKRDFFGELNITGKDYYGEHLDFFGFYFHGTPLHLRRYQVLDEMGRSIDIREWPQSVWQDKPLIAIDCEIYYSGKKRNSRRMSGPSMWRKSVREASKEVWTAEELGEENLPLPIMDRSAIRSRVVECKPYDYAERHFYGKYAPSRSWKKRSRAKAQWGALSGCTDKESVREKMCVPA